MSIFLGIDVGTQSVKVVCYDADERQIIASVRSSLKLIQDANGRREQLAHWWLEALHDCIKGIPLTLRQLVKAIAVSGQQHGFVPLDKQGNVLAPVKLWCDTSTSRDNDAIVETLGGQQQCLTISGNAMRVGYTASKLSHFKAHDVSYAQLHSILLPHDYINYYLTGILAMEYGDASGTGLLDVRTRTWSTQVLKAVDDERDLAECLPPLVEADSVLGCLKPEVAVAMGLSNDVIVAPGGGDNMMAAIASGCFTEGPITASLGTSGTLFTYSDSPVVDMQGDVAAFCSSTGGWLPLVCTMNCTVATELTRRLFDVPLAELDAQVASAKIGCAGVTMLPFFQGERCPDLPEAKGTLLGMHEGNMRPENLIRAAMESAVFSLRSAKAHFERLSCTTHSFRVTGGGASSAQWCQMLADVCDYPVQALRDDEGAAFGAALQAMWVCDGSQTPIASFLNEHIALDDRRVFMPDCRRTQAYEDAYGRYRNACELLGPIFKKLAY